VTHRNEFPAGYSLAGCSPAAPVSASPAALILNRKQLVRQQFSVNGSCSLLLFVSNHRAVHPPSPAPCFNGLRLNRLTRGDF
jgi:hypothetical protein